MPTGLSFVDANIFIYRANVRDGEKWRIASDLCDRENIGISTQVLQEFYVAATHPRKLGLSPADVMPLIKALMDCRCL